MALYESTIIIRPDLTQSDVQEVAKKFEDIIKNAKGKTVKTEFWGLRELSYRIHKNKKGHYVHFGFESNAEGIAELKRKYGISEDVIRELTIKVDDISKEAGNDNLE